MLALEQPVLNIAKPGKPPKKESAVEERRFQGIQEVIQSQKKHAVKLIADSLSGEPHVQPPSPPEITP